MAIFRLKKISLRKTSLVMLIIITMLISFIAVKACSVKTVNVSKKISLKDQTDLAKHANEVFWDNFHQGNYEEIPNVINILNAAYLENPNDVETVLHLGFAHIWALSESGKLEVIPPTIIDHGVLSLKYFGEAYKLNPKDPRALGFLADLKMIVGNLSADDGLTREGYIDGLASIRKWKEFNYFTIGYVLSGLPHDSWQFEKGLEWQWETLDACLGEKVDRENFTSYFSKYYSLKEQSKTDIKKDRACLNSWIAPHNLEGFFFKPRGYVSQKWRNR